MNLVVEQRKEPTADSPKGLTSARGRRHGDMADQAPLRTTPAVALLVATRSTPLEPQNARAPTAQEGTNIKGGSIQGKIGDYIPPVIGRDKRDLNTSAANRKVAPQTGSADATIRQRVDLGKTTQPLTTSPARRKPRSRASPVLSSTSDSPARLGGDTDATNREMVDLPKPTKPLTTYPSGYKPLTSILSSSEPSVRVMNSAKSSFPNAQAAAVAKTRDRVIAEAGNIGKGGPGDTSPPGVVRLEDQDPIALTRRLPSLPNTRWNILNSLPLAEGVESQEQIALARRLPSLPNSRSNTLNSLPPAEGVESQEQIALSRRLPGLPNSRSNTLNSLPPPEEGVESQEQALVDAEKVDFSDDDSNEYSESDDIYEDARALSEKLATPGFKESLTQEEYEALCRQRFQIQQQEAHRKMYMQQQQILEVAQALVPKLPGSRSTTTVLGIGVGGSSDKPQSSKEQSLRRKIVELEHALQQANSSAKSRANAQSEELQRSQHQVHRLLDDNRNLTHELEDVKAQLADAKSLLEAKRKELKDAQVFLATADRLSTTDVVQKVNTLNEEIFQAAALLGEMLHNAERTDRTQEHITESLEKARWMLGEQMANTLTAESMNLRTDLNPLLVQVVLQIAITTWCRFVVSSWKPGDSTVADFLAAIYSDIRQVGE